MAKRLTDLQKKGLSGSLTPKTLKPGGSFFYENKKYHISRVKLDAKTKDEAFQEISNRWPHVALTGTKPPYSVSQALKDWSKIKKPSVGSIDFKQRAFKVFVESTGVKDLTLIKGAHVNQFISYLERTPIEGPINRLVKERTPNTISKYVGACRTVFSSTIDYHHCEVNPFSCKGPSVEDVKKAVQNRQPFTLEEIELLIEKMVGWQKVAAVIGKFTALRFGDVLNMEWERIDFEKKLIKPILTSKRKRIVDGFPIKDNQFWETLSWWKKYSLIEDSKGIYLFPERRAKSLEPGKKSYPGADWNRTMKKYINDKNSEGRKNKGFHSFRSYAVTRMRVLGMDDVDIMKFTGHTNIKMLEIYDNPTEEERIKRAIMLNEKLEALENKFDLRNKIEKEGLLPDKVVTDEQLELLAEALKAKIPKEKLALLAKLIL